MLQQVLAMTSIHLRSIPQRLGASLVIVVGIAGVVAVVVALLSMARGFQSTLASTGRSDRVVVLRSGSNDELSSVLFRQQALVIEEAPGVRRSPSGRPLALTEVYLLSGLPRRGSAEPTNVVIRGTQAQVFEVRPEARIVEGRSFRPGLYEVIVGQGARAQFAGLRLGATVPLRGGDWTVVGFFSSQGDVHESELWTDAETLMAAARRGAPTSVTVQLQSPAHFASFRQALMQDPRVNVNVQREADYYASRSQALNRVIHVLGYTVGVIMAIGALFGALNTMYAAVASRFAEIATLRAIGFGAVPVVASVLAEAMLLALLGGALGAGLSYAIFNGYQVSTLNLQTFSQVAFAFRVTPDLLLQGLLWSLTIGFLGGLFPALRAVRVSVVEALRE